MVRLDGMVNHELTVGGLFRGYTVKLKIPQPVALKGCVLLPESLTVTFMV